MAGRMAVAGTRRCHCGPAKGGRVAQRGFQLPIASGTDWRVGSGMVVTFAGIVVALGQLGHWRELGETQNL